MPIFRVNGPDGRTFEVTAPDGATSEQAILYTQQTYYSQDIPQPVQQPPPEVEDQSIFRSVADIPLQVGMGATMGVRMVTDAFGANNPVSKALSGVEDYMDSLLSAQAKDDQAEIGRIMQEAEDKGIAENIKAAAKAFATAPADQIANILGTSIPFIATGLLGSIGAAGRVAAATKGLTGTALKSATTAAIKKEGLRVGKYAAAMGAVGGAGEGKNQIYETVKHKLIETGVPEDMADNSAMEAQSYGGKNTGSIIGATVLGAIAAGLGIETLAAKMLAVKLVKELVEEGVIEGAKKSVLTAGAKGLATEAIPEMAQEAQQQYAGNVALQKEGFDVPSERGVAGSAALAGMLSLVPGAGAPAFDTAMRNKAIDKFNDSKIARETEEELIALEAKKKAIEDEYNKQESVPLEVQQEYAQTVEQLDYIDAQIEAQREAERVAVLQQEAEYARARGDGTDTTGDGTSVPTYSGQTDIGGATVAPTDDGRGRVGGDSRPANLINNREESQPDTLNRQPDTSPALAALSEQTSELQTKARESEKQALIDRTLAGEQRRQSDIPLTPAVNTLTKEMFDAWGVPRRAGIRARLVGKNINDSTVREALLKFAKTEARNGKYNNNRVPMKRALAIQRFLQNNVLGNQGELDLQKTEKAQNDKKKRLTKSEAARKREAKGVDPQKDSLLTAIAKYGGLDKSEAAESMNIDKADLDKTQSGIKYVFRAKGGKTLDEMAESLAQDNYPVFDEDGNYNPNSLVDALDRAIRGEQVYSADGAMEQAASAYAKDAEDKYYEQDEDKYYEQESVPEEAPAVKETQTAAQGTGSANEGENPARDTSVRQTNAEYTADLKAKNDAGTYEETTTSVGEAPAVEQLDNIDAQIEAQREAEIEAQREAERVAVPQANIITILGEELQSKGYPLPDYSDDPLTEAELAELLADVKTELSPESTEEDTSIEPITEEQSESNKAKFRIEQAEEILPQKYRVPTTAEENEIIEQAKRELSQKINQFSAEADLQATNPNDPLLKTRKYWAAQEAQRAQDNLDALNATLEGYEVQEYATELADNRDFTGPKNPYVPLIKSQADVVRKKSKQNEKLKRILKDVELELLQQNEKLKRRLKDVELELLQGHITPTRRDFLNRARVALKAKISEGHITPTRRDFLNRARVALKAKISEMRNDRDAIERKEIADTVSAYRGTKEPLTESQVEAETAKWLLSVGKPDALDPVLDIVYVSDMLDHINEFTQNLMRKYSLPLSAETEVRAYVDRVIKNIYADNAINSSTKEASVDIYIIKRLNALANVYRASTRPISTELKNRAKKILADIAIGQDEKAVAQSMANISNAPNRPKAKKYSFLYAPVYKGPQLGATGKTAIRNGDLQGLMTHLIVATQNPVMQKILRKIRDLNLTTTISFGNVTQRDASGYYDADTNRILIDEKTGANEHTITHELVHAAISHVLRNRNHKLTRELTKLFNEVKDQLAGKYGVSSVQEFAAELAGNGDFQASLKTIPRGNIFSRALKAIAEFFGFAQNNNAFAEGLQLVNDLIDVSQTVYSPAPSGGRYFMSKNTEAVEKKVKGNKNFYGANKAAFQHLSKLISTRSTVDEKIQIFKAAWNGLNETRRRQGLRLFSRRGLFKLAAELGFDPKRVKETLDNQTKYSRDLRHKMEEELFSLLDYVKQTKDNGRQLADAVHIARLLQVDSSQGGLAKVIAQDEKIIEIENLRIQRSLNKSLAATAKRAAEQQTEKREVEIEYAFEKYNALSDEGKRLYTMMKDRFEFIFEETKNATLSDIRKLAQIALDAEIERRAVAGEQPLAEDEQKKYIADAVDAAEKLFNQLHKENVYFPLTRMGDYWVRIGKGRRGKSYFYDNRISQELAFSRAQAEEKAEGNLAEGESSKVTKGTNEDTLIREVFNDPDNRSSATTALAAAYAKVDSLVSAAKLKNATTETGKVDLDNIGDTLRKAMVDMYLRSLPGEDIHKKYIATQGKEGFSPDVLRVFAGETSRAISQLPRLKYGRDIRTATTEMWDALEGDTGAQNRLSPLYAEIYTRNVNALATPPTSNGLNLELLSSLGTQAVFFMVMTSAKSAAVQMTQVPMIALPRMYGRYGFAKTNAMIGKYLAHTATFNSMGLHRWNTKGTLDATKLSAPTFSSGKYALNHENHANLRLLDMEMISLGAYETGLSGTIGALKNTPTESYNSGFSQTKRVVSTMMGGLFLNAERLSREFVAHVSYELAYNKAVAEGLAPGTDGEAHKRALEEAKNMVSEGMFIFTRDEKPPIMNTPLLRPAFQFMTYQMQLYGLMWDSFNEMLPLLDNKHKKEAAIQFFGTMGMTFLFAGATGFPAYTMLMGVLEGLRESARDDDDPWYDANDAADISNPLAYRDLRVWFERWYIPHYFGSGSDLAKILKLSDGGADMVARSITMGPISAMTDGHWGSSTSMDGMWLRDEIMSDDARNWLESIVYSKLTGALGNVAGGMASGIEDIYDGRTARGLEKLVPAFFRGPLAAIRISEEGARGRDDRVILPKEFFTFGKIFAQVGGLKSTTLAERQRLLFMASNMAREVTTAHNKFLNVLNTKYVKYEKNPTDRNFQDFRDKLLEVKAYNMKDGAVAPLYADSITTSLKSRAEARITPIKQYGSKSLDFFVHDLLNFK